MERNLILNNLVNIDDGGENEKERLERFRTFNLVFNMNLPALVLKDLLNEKTFISKYARINSAKIDDEIQALLINDHFGINFVLNSEGIQARSALIEDKEKIIGALKKMADQIIKLYDLDFEYKLNDSLDFRYIENFNLQKAINGAEITKLLRKEFGNNIFAIVCKFICKTNEGEKVLNLVYPNSEDLNNKRLLIEADEKYIERLYGVLKND